MSTLLIKNDVTDELLNIGLDVMTAENFVQQPWRATASGESETVLVHVTGPKGGQTIYPVVVGPSKREGQTHTWYGTIWCRQPGKDDRREQVFNGMADASAVKHAVLNYLNGVYGRQPVVAAQPINPVADALPANVEAVVQNVVAANVQLATKQTQPQAAVEEQAVPPAVQPGQCYASVVCTHTGPEQFVSVGGVTGFEDELSVKRALYHSAKKRRYNFAACISGYILSVAQSQGNNKPHAKVMEALVANCSRDMAAKILTRVATNETGAPLLTTLIYEAPAVDQIAIALAVGCLKIKKAKVAIPGTVEELAI